MISKIIASFIGNGAALLTAAYVVSGFDLNLTTGAIAFAGLIAVLTFISIIIKPLLRLILGPLIIVTFGLFNLVINAGILFIVDKYSENLTITGLPALLYGTVIITLVNVIIHQLFKTSGD